MEDKKKNRCPLKALKRAGTDVRCGAKKLGVDETAAVIIGVFGKAAIEAALAKLSDA